MLCSSKGSNLNALGKKVRSTLAFISEKAIDLTPHATASLSVKQLDS